MNITRENARKEHNECVLFIVLFLCVLGIVHHIPLTVDDNGFRNLSFTSFSEAFDFLVHYGNGRFLGNGGIIFLMHHLLISDLIRAAVIAGIAMLLPKALGIKGQEYALLSLFLLLSISPGIFGQTYSWMSGFQNYVPPVFLFIISIILIRYGNNGKKSIIIMRYSLILLSGVLMQFYIEHSSCLNFLIAFVMTVWSFRKRKQSFLGCFMLLIGTFIGLLLMFFATLFVAPTIHGGVDSYFFGGIGLFFRGILRNAVLLYGMYTENVIAIVMLSSLLMTIMYHERLKISRKIIIIISVGLTIPNLIFIGIRLSGLSPWYGKLALFESGLLLVAFLWYSLISAFAFYQLEKTTRSREIRLSGLMYFAAHVCIMPVLFVWPVGYRCLFHSSVMMFGAILFLVKELKVEKPQFSGNNRVTFIAIALLATTVINLTAVFADIRRMVKIREEYLEMAAKTGSYKAAYFTIPSPYIHESWYDDHVHNVIIDGHSLQLEIVPADVWFRMYYYEYS